MNRSRTFFSTSCALALRLTFALLLFAHPSALVASGLQVVKAANHEVTSGGTTTVPITIAAGDLAVVWCSESINNTSTVKITDSSGGKNAWTQTSSGYVSVSPTARGAMFYSSLVAQLTSVTCSWSGGLNGRVQGVVYDISGAASSGIEDASVHSTNPNNVKDFFSNASGNNLTTTNGNNILLFGMRVTADENSFTAGSNYAIASGASGKRSTMSYRIVSSTQSAVTTDISYPNAAVNEQGIYAAFKAAGGTGGTSPSIMSLSPTSGLAGTSVTITGTNFGASQGSSTVTFNGTSATPTSWSATSITVPVPSGATSGNVVVTVGGVPSNAVVFTVIVPPNITGIIPTFAQIGGSVTISGTNLGGSQGSSTVTFNGTAGTPTGWSDTSITVPVPSGATSGNVVVTVNGLASNGVAFRVAPFISNVSPTSGPTGTSVTITGTSFGATQGSSAVTLGASTMTPTSWSDTTIVAPVPAAATTGNVIVMVNGVGSNRVLFTVTPAITSLSPTSGPVGTSVTITGSGYGTSQAGSTVTFNGTAATPTNWSASSIVVPVPSGATTGNVVVSVGGVASNGSPFTVLVPPSITSLSPTSGGVGASVTITGTNFGATQGASAVTFNGTAATPTSWSASSIVVPVPSGSTTGNVVVTVSGLASNGVAFTVTPNITSLSPNSGPIGYSVTIIGTSFGASQGTSTITFNGTVASPTSWSATSIVAPVPNGATAGNVVVTVGGFASNGVAFTVMPPSIGSLSPTSGPVGTSVTIIGGAWGSSQGTSTVTFNGTLATPTSWSAASIVVPVPAGATTGSVVVTFGGLTSNPVQFTVAPAITSLSPTLGPVGTSVTITGTTFGTAQLGSTVAFNGILSSPTSWTPTSIVVPVPNGASTGNVVVAVSTGGASNGVLFTVTPFISGLNPFLGDMGTPITISGSNFGATQGSSTVTFNGTLATPTSWSDTSIVAPVPASATTGNMVVTVGGFASNAANFTVAPDNTPPTAPGNLTATASSAGEVDLYWTASTDNVGVTGYQIERCQGAGCTNFTLIATLPEPNTTTSMGDFGVVGSTSYSYRVRATDAAGNFSVYSNIASATTAGAATITSVNPASGVVGTSVTITGTGFGPAQVTSAVTFNGTHIGFATSWSDTNIVVPVPNGATTGNVVVTVGSLPSNGVNFTVTLPPPPPIITTMGPSSAMAGSGPLTITVTGANFASSSTVQWNGNALATTFLSSTQLQAQITSSNIATQGVAKVTVSNAVGSVSNASIFLVGTTGGSNFAAIVLNQAAQDIVYDPQNQVFYLSVPSTASSFPNQIVSLDPATLAITPAPFTANNPNVLSISGDSQFLYAGIDGTSTVQRFILPGLTPDISYPLGSNFFGPFFAVDLQVAPGAPHTTAVSLGNSGLSTPADGGITIFDDATPRPTNAQGPGKTYSSIQWGSDTSTLFASDTEDTGFDFYTLAVNSSGVTLNQDYPTTFSNFGANIHFDPVTNLVYSDDGHAVNPSTGLPVGNFNANANGVMAEDAGLNTAFFANTNSSSVVTIGSFDLTHFTPINTITIPGVTGRPSHLIRWGQNGLALINNTFNSNVTIQVVLLVGDFVTAAPAFVTTTPPPPAIPPTPAPNAPTITSLNPSSTAASSGGLLLNVTGTQFDPAATVQFNGNALSTSYISTTRLQALIPAGSIASPGAASVVVANPPASGGNSGSATFFVGSGAGNSTTWTGYALQIMNQASKQIAFDPASQRIYISVPNTVATGNTVAVLDLPTATIVGQQYAGSNPDILALSDDGQFLYAGIDGSSSVQRFTLPALGTDISYPLGAGPNFIGAYFALDLQVAPGSPHTSAVTLGAFNSSPAAIGGIEIFDDATARPTTAKGFGPGGGTALYDSLQWGADATALFASNSDDSGYDFYTLSVTASGVSQTSDKMHAFSNFHDKIHFDRGTQLIYADNGQVLNPSTGAVVGTFSVPGPFAPAMVPDSNLNLAFFAIQTGYPSSIVIYSYNLSTFAPVSSITIAGLNGNPIRLIRWGQNGLAFNTDAGQIVLVGGNFVH